MWTFRLAWSCFLLPSQTMDSGGVSECQGSGMPVGWREYVRYKAPFSFVTWEQDAKQVCELHVEGYIRAENHGNYPFCANSNLIWVWKKSSDSTNVLLVFQYLQTCNFKLTWLLDRSKCGPYNCVYTHPRYGQTRWKPVTQSYGSKASWQAKTARLPKWTSSFRRRNHWAPTG